MANAVATFPLYKIVKSPPDDFLAKAKALAKEENVTLLQYVAGMLRHALRGHDLSKIHFYQDGSGDTYNVDVIDKAFKQMEEESKAGLTTVCNGDEEVVALLDQWEKESDERIRNGNKVSA